MKKGDYIRQEHTGVIGLLVDVEPGGDGAFKALCHDWRGRIVERSTWNWYPEPVVIDKNQVPQKVIAKILEYLANNAARRGPGLEEGTNNV